MVEKDGEVTLPSIVRPLDARLDTAALQVIETMPRWIAGKDNGVKVRCKYSVPIRFKKPAPAAPLSPEDSVRMVLQAQREDSISKLPPRAVRTPLVSKSEIPLPELSTADSTRFKIPEQYLVKSDASVRPEPKSVISSYASSVGCSVKAMTNLILSHSLRQFFSYRKEFFIIKPRFHDPHG